MMTTQRKIKGGAEWTVRPWSGHGIDGQARACACVWAYSRDGRSLYITASVAVAARRERNRAWVNMDTDSEVAMRRARPGEKKNKTHPVLSLPYLTLFDQGVNARHNTRAVYQSPPQPRLPVLIQGNRQRHAFPRSMCNLFLPLIPSFLNTLLSPPFIPSLSLVRFQPL